jgi:hypothetical protein
MESHCISKPGTSPFLVKMCLSMAAPLTIMNLTDSAEKPPVFRIFY